jgi:hypothetical protein
MSTFDLQALAPGQRELLTQSRRVTMGNGDRKAPVLRPGAMDAMQLPSRMGSRLVWRDGRVESVEEARR